MALQKIIDNLLRVDIGRNTVRYYTSDGDYLFEMTRNDVRSHDIASLLIELVEQGVFDKAFAKRFKRSLVESIRVGFKALLNNRILKEQDGEPIDIEPEEEEPKEEIGVEDEADEEPIDAGEDNDKERKTVVFIWGKYNPPTKSHLKEFELTLRTAQKLHADGFVLASHVQDRNDDPLMWDEKIKFLSRMVPKGLHVFKEPDITTIFEALTYFYNKHYTDVVLYQNEEEVADVRNKANFYNDKESNFGYYNFKTIQVESTGQRNQDKAPVTPEDQAALNREKKIDALRISGTLVRNAALQGDFELFKKAMPDLPNDSNYAKDLYSALTHASDPETTFREEMLLYMNETLHLSKEELQSFFKETSTEKLVDLYETINEIQEADNPVEDPKSLRVEDNLYSGFTPARYIVRTLRDMYNALKGDVPKNKITSRLRVDGAPSIVAATNFHGERFITTEEYFKKQNEEKKIAKTPEDIIEYFGSDPSLARKMKELLIVLPLVGIPVDQIWQGDILFDKEDLETEFINNEECITFKPDVTMYAVPLSDPDAEKILVADIGIVWHTRYRGETLDNTTPTFDVSPLELTPTDRVFYMDSDLPSVGGKITFTGEETSQINGLLTAIESQYLTMRDVIEYIPTNPTLQDLLIEFEEDTPEAELRQFDKEGKDHIKDFALWVEKQYRNKIEVTEDAQMKQAYEAEMQDALTAIQEWNIELGDLIELQRFVSLLKDIFIIKLNSLPYSSRILLDTVDKGYIPTGQEGLAVSDEEGDVQKLISQLNLSLSDWSKDILRKWMTKKQHLEGDLKEKINPDTYDTVDSTAKKLGLLDPPQGPNKPTVSTIKYYDPSNKRQTAAEKMVTNLVQKGVSTELDNTGTIPTARVSDDIGETDVQLRDQKGLARSASNKNSVETRHFYEFKKIIKDAVVENGGPITVILSDNITEAKIENVFGLARMVGNPKADWAFINKKKEFIFYVSHKAGESARSFQQYGGIKGLEASPFIVQFAKAVHMLFPNQEVPRGTKMFMKIPNSQPGLQLKAKAVYGINFESGTYGVNNVNALLQGYPVVSVMEDGIYKIEVFHMDLNPVVPGNEYDPVMYITYRSDRDQLGMTKTRFGFYSKAYGGISILDVLQAREDTDQMAQKIKQDEIE